MASFSTIRCVSRSPAGVSITNLPGGSAFACTASTQSTTGCAISTIPGPPPNGPVVHALVLVLRPVANVPRVNLNQPSLDRVFEQALPYVPVEDTGKQR